VEKGEPTRTTLHPHTDKNAVEKRGHRDHAAGSGRKAIDHLSAQDEALGVKLKGKSSESQGEEKNL